MADEAASLVVRITGDASELAATISSVEGQLSAFERKQGKSDAAVKGINTTNTALKQTESSLKQLESSMAKQKDTTLSYTKSLRESAAVFREKKAAVQEVAKSYKTNTAALKENGENLRYQVKLLDGTVATNRERIAGLQSENKHLKRSSAEYKANQNAIKSMRAENTQLHTDRKALTAAIKDNDNALSSETAAYKRAQSEVKKAASDYKNMQASVAQAKNTEKEYADAIAKTNQQMAEQTDAADKTVQKSQQQVKQAVQQTKEISCAEQWKSAGKAMKELGEGIDQVAKPLYTTSLALAAGGVASAKFAIDFENNFAAVKKTVEGTPEELEAVKKGIIALTTTGINGRSAIPAATADLTELAAAGGQLGIKTPNILEFTEVMAQMGSATNLAGEEGAATLAKFMNIMDVSQDKVRNVGSAIVDLGNNSATTEADIAAMALRLGKYGQTVGIGAADVLGYSAALSSLGIEAQMGGSAVGRTWLEIETAVASGGDELKAFAKYSGKSAKEFREQWNTNATGAFNGLLKGLKSAENLTVAMSELGIENTQDKQAIMALVNGYDLVTESVERGNTAWAENTALQKEANAMAETTAGQLAITKNNLVEAARSMGELMLPTIASASTTVAGFAQKLAGMSDESKQALVKTGAGIIGLGLATKVTAGTIKTVGDTIEGYGKLKSLFSTGGALAKFAPALTGIASAAGPAALAVAGITAAVVGGKVAYDSWYDSQFKWSKGLSDGNAEVEKSFNAYKKISDIQKELRDLKVVINSDDSSTEQVEQAKARIEEIKQLLSEEYNLVIKTDNSNLDDIVDDLKTVTKNELQSDLNTQSQKLTGLQPKIQEYHSRKQELEDESAAALNAQSRYSEFLVKVAALDKGTQDYAQSVRDLGVEYGVTQEWQKKIADPSVVKINAQTKYNEAGKDVEKYKGELEDLQASYKEAQEVATELANTETELIRRAASEGDSAGVKKALEGMKDFIELGELDMSGFAQNAALAMNGIESLESVWEAAESGDGTKLDAVVKDYIESMKTFGATAQETAVGASLLKNGFENIDGAIEAGKLDVVTKQANELAHGLGLIPDDKYISINAEGDISVLENVQEAIDKVNSEGNITLDISTNGDISVLETADEKLKALAKNGNVDIKFNADTKGFDIFDLQGKKLGEITVDGKINWDIGETPKTIPDAIGKAIFELGGSPETVPDASGKAVFGLGGSPETVPNAAGKADFGAGSSPETVPNASGDADFSLGKSPEKVPDASGVANFGLGTYPTSIPDITATVNAEYKKQAKGTQNFPGGLAMVNDQRGVSDPRELILDNGRAFIPDGRDVILPLSKGAKVYTAKQTRDIMNNLGIPRYAKGKDNSDAFITARDNYSHYTKTNAVTTSQELEKWVEFSKQFKDNVKDVEDIEEQIFSLMRKQRQEMNEQSNQYLEDLAYMYQWEELGDNDYAAWQRIEARNREALQSQKITYDEYFDTINSAGKTLLDNRTQHSLDWLEHERKYNKMSTEDYIAGLKRVQTYTQEYYESGIVDKRTYYDANKKINEQILDSELELAQEQKDTAQERVDAYFKSADNYYKIRETFGDWDEVGDSKIRFYTAELANIERMRREGDLEWQDYMDYSMDKYLELYKSYEEAYDDKLQDFKDEMSDISSTYADMRTDLQSGWAQEDRDDDLTEVNRLLGIYKNAVTDAGMQKYNELLEQKKQLERDQELADLEKEEKEALDKMQAQYDSTEAEKKRVLKDLRTDTFKVFSGVEDVNVDTSDIKKLADITANTILQSANTEANQLGLLDALLEAANKIATRVGTSKTSSNVYYNNGTYHISSAQNSQALIKQLTGTIASGLGSVIIG